MFLVHISTNNIPFSLAAIKNGESTPILDAIVFKKIRALLGGSLTLMVGAGAPLCKETHEFMRVCLGVPVWQGYGCTEVIATASLTDNDEIGTENVGNPYQVIHFKRELLKPFLITNNSRESK